MSGLRTVSESAMIRRVQDKKMLRECCKKQFHCHKQKMGMSGDLHMIISHTGYGVSLIESKADAGALKLMPATKSDRKGSGDHLLHYYAYVQTVVESMMRWRLEVSIRRWAGLSCKVVATATFICAAFGRSRSSGRDFRLDRK